MLGLEGAFEITQSHAAFLEDAGPRGVAARSECRLCVLSARCGFHLPPINKRQRQKIVGVFLLLMFVCFVIKENILRNKGLLRYRKSRAVRESSVVCQMAQLGEARGTQSSSSDFISKRSLS